MSKGIDGHDGKTFDDFTRGETLPFTFTFTDEDTGDPENVSGWRVYIAFSIAKVCNDASPPYLEVVFLPQDAENGIISGEISDDQTFSLPAGSVYASARFITADGRTFITDKAKLKVFPCINPRRAQ